MVAASSLSFSVLSLLPFWFSVIHHCLNHEHTNTYYYYFYVQPVYSFSPSQQYPQSRRYPHSLSSRSISVTTCCLKAKAQATSYNDDDDKGGDGDKATAAATPNSTAVVMAFLEAPTTSTPQITRNEAPNRMFTVVETKSSLQQEKHDTKDTHTTTTATEAAIQNESGWNPFQGWLQQFLGLEQWTADLTAIVVIYFVQGALGLASLAKTYLLKDELHLGPAELSALTGLFVLPWTIKPVYGFLSDGFPFFGYRRKSYLILAGILGALSYGILSIDGFWNTLLLLESGNTMVIAGTVAALLLSSACIAFSDVVADGIVVTKTRQTAASNPNVVAGGLQSLCWGASAMGGLLSAYFSGSLLQILPVRYIFGITAVMPLLVAVIACFMTEEKQQQLHDLELQDDPNVVWKNIQTQSEQLWQVFQQPSIWKPTLFLFLWQSTPTADGAFFFFLSNDLGLGPEFLGRVRLVTSLATLAGVGLYNTYFKTVPIKAILKWSTIASFPLGLIPILLTTHYNQVLGIPDQALIYGDDVILAMLGEIAFLPCLVLAARLCPPGIEAVLFATLMSIFNGASTVGTELGAAITKFLGITESNFDNLTWLILLCNLTSLYPLALLGFLDEMGDKSEQELENEQQPLPQSQPENVATKTGA